MAFDAGSVLAQLKLDSGGFTRGLLQAEALMSLFPSQVTNFLASPLLGFIGLAQDAGRALTGFLGTGIRLAAEFEQTEIAFKTFLGSADAALALLAEINDFAAETPFRLPELNQAATSLLAFNFRAEETVPTLRRLGDLAAGVNQPIAELAVIYGKARIAGRLFAEDVNQLTERGIPIISELAKQFGVAESAVKQLVERGEVNFSHLEEALRSLTDEGGRFAGLTQAQSQSVLGLWSTLQDNVEAMQREMGISLIKAFDLGGGLSVLAAGVGAVTPILVGLSDTIGGGLAAAVGTLPDLLTRVGDAAQSLAPIFTFVADHAVTLGSAFAGVGAVIGSSAVAGAILSFGPTLLAIVSPLNLVTLGVRGLTGAVALLTSPLTITATLLGAVAAAALLPAETFGPLAPAVRVFQDALGQLADVVTGRVLPAIGEQLSRAFAVVQPYLPTTASLMASLRSAMEATAGFVTGTLIPAVGDGLVAALQFAAPYLPMLQEGLATVGAMAMQVGGWIMETAVPAIGDGLAFAFAVAAATAPMVLAALGSVYDYATVAVAWVQETAIPTIQTGLTSAWLAVQPAVAVAGSVLASVWELMQSIAGWIAGTFVPTVGGILVTAWQSLQPVVEGAIGYLGSVWDVLSGMATWIAGVGAPAVGGWLVGAFRALRPVLSGVGSVIQGLWDLGVGVVRFLVGPVLSVLSNILGPVIRGTGLLIEGIGDVLGPLWSNIVWPIFEFLGGAALAILDKVGQVIGWVLDKLGQALSWLGDLLGGTQEVADEVAAISPAVPAAATSAPDDPLAERRRRELRRQQAAAREAAMASRAGDMVGVSRVDVQRHLLASLEAGSATAMSQFRMPPIPPEAMSGLDASLRQAGSSLNGDFAAALRAAQAQGDALGAGLDQVGDTGVDAARRMFAAWSPIRDLFRDVSAEISATAAAAADAARSASPSFAGRRGGGVNVDVGDVLVPSIDTRELALFVAEAVDDRIGRHLDERLYELRAAGRAAATGGNL